MRLVVHINHHCEVLVCILNRLDRIIGIGFGVKDIGVKCANCVMWEGGTTCKIIALPVEAEAKCRLAVIPDGVVQKSK